MVGEKRDLVPLRSSCLLLPGGNWLGRTARLITPWMAVDATGIQVEQQNWGEYGLHLVF